MTDDFDALNKAQWSAAISQTFGTAPLQSAHWTDLDMMLHVLSHFMGQDLNHTMLPGSGGHDMAAVARSTERGCLEFSPSPRVAEVFRPATLFFEHFPESPWNSFFLMETQPLQACGVYEEGDVEYEEVLELAPGEYADRVHIDEGNLGYDEAGREIPLPERWRLVVRRMRGKFLVVAKRSIWNTVSETYDGRHNRMTAQQIREEVQDAVTGDEQ